jgi:hypothetical protein
MAGAACFLFEFIKGFVEVFDKIVDLITIQFQADLMNAIIHLTDKRLRAFYSPVGACVNAVVMAGDALLVVQRLTLCSVAREQCGLRAASTDGEGYQ